jgi:hypothetical protein
MGEFPIIDFDYGDPVTVLIYDRYWIGEECSYGADRGSWYRMQWI